jgi:nucleoside-diphosphate-sugar epimerase
MKILLTGPFGKIGYRVVEALLAKGYLVTCFDLDTTANRKTARDFAGQVAAGRVKVIWGDITNAEQVASAVKGQDAVVHNAAIIPPLSDINPALAERVNVGGTKNILSAIQRSDKKPQLVFPSSISVHGFNAPDSPYPKKITAPFRAEDCYAGHKILCEQLIEDAEKQWGLRWVIVRIGACMEGRNPMDTENGDEMMQMMFGIAAKARIEYIHPKDVAAAMANAIGNAQAIGKKFFLGGGKPCQTYWGEFNSMFLIAMGCPPFPDSVFGTQGYYTDWMDTKESQRVLQFQNHTLADYRAELDRKFKYVRPFLFPFRSLILRYLMAKSPNLKK